MKSDYNNKLGIYCQAQKGAELQNFELIMKSLKTLLTIVTMFMAILFFSQFARGQLPTDVDNTSLAVTYDKVIDDVGWGFLGAVPFHLGPIDGHVSAIFQGGDVIRGKYHIEGILPLGAFGIKLFGDGGARGDTWDTLGKQLDFGGALQTPDVEISGIDAKVGFGVFARNSGEFGRLSARDVLEENNFNPEDLDGLGLENIKVPKRGLSYPAGSSWQALGFAGFDHKSGVSGQVKYVRQLTGEDKTQQVIGSLFISRDIGANLAVELGTEAGYQLYQEVWESEYAFLSAISVNF